MIITRYLLDTAQGLLDPPLPEITNEHYMMFDAGGVECEVGEFLHGLVRVVKPERILETGTRYGHAAAYLALGLRENGGGHLTTIEINPAYTQMAAELMGRIGCGAYVTCVCGDATQYTPSEPQDMIFLDSEIQMRFGDWVRLWPWLKEGGYLICHDLHRQMNQGTPTLHGIDNYPLGTLPQEIHDWIAQGELQSFHFATGRGLYVGQKARGDFHSTKILRGRA